nr:sodium-dependent proline transporter-like [Onthophagus taurus]
MQVSIGQYTQRGVLFIKEISPIVHGTAYTTLLTNLAHSIKLATNMGVTLIYMLSSLKSNAPWLQCPEALDCWNGSHPCQQDCLNAHIASAKFYYIIMHSGYIPDFASGVLWMIKKLLPISCCWFLLIVCLGYSKISYRKLITIMLFIVGVLFGVVFAAPLLTHGGIKFSEYLIKMSMKQFVSKGAWAVTFVQSFRVLNLGRGLHITTGTFLAPKAHSALLSIGVTVIVYAVIIIMSCLAFTSYYVLFTFGHTTELGLITLWEFSSTEVVLVAVPQSLEFMNMPQFWSFNFFACCLLMNMNCLIVNIIILEKCFTDSNPKLQKYRVYTTLVVATLIFVMGILGNKDYTTTATAVILYRVAELCEIINITILVVAVCVLHGVQTFCDDLHFMTGFPVTRSWKVAWYLMPVIYIILCAVSVQHYYNEKMGFKFNMAHKRTILICGAVFLSPIFLFAFYEIWQYMKKKNLVGLFKSTELYGSQDPEERHLRNVYNPRTEIKSKRKNDSCRHRCLINNRAYQKAVNDEKREAQQGYDHESHFSEEIQLN